MIVKNCEKIEKSQVVLTVEVNAAEFEVAIEKAYKKMRKEISIQGFRPGKAPRKVIERMYGVEVFFDEAINNVFPEAYEAAVKAKELRVVGYPTNVEIVGECTVEGFTFKATAPVYPEVTLGEYKGISAPKDEVKVTASDVDDRLKELQVRNSHVATVDRAAVLGDTAVIDFEGFVDGVAFEGGKGENFELELGSGTFIPGFEEQVMGMNAGDEKDVSVTFPEDYHAELAGKDAVFKVKCHEVKGKELPELDDEFAKDVSEFDTLKELKADLKKQITEECELKAKHKFEDDLMAIIADGITAEIPEAMVELQANQFIDNFKSQLAQQGFPYEAYAEMSGMTTDELTKKLLEDAHEPALRQCRVDVAISAIIEAEGIEASDEECEAEMQKVADQYGLAIDMVKEYTDMDQLRGQVRRQKALDLVVANAVATKPEKKTTKKAAKKTEEAVEEAAEGEEKPKKTRKTTKKAEAEKDAE